MLHVPNKHMCSPPGESALSSKLGKDLLCIASAHLLELDLKNSESMDIMYQRGYIQGLKDEPGIVLILSELSA